MTSFLSTISGQFGKNILIGTFFPAVLFAMALVAVVLPLAAITPRFAFELIFPWEQDSTLLALTVFVLIVTVLLFALNIPLLKLYEGYPWKESWLGQWGITVQQRRVALLDQVLNLSNHAREANVSDALGADWGRELLTPATRMRGAFPNRAGSILPTRLGNVIRAFEGYSSSRYGIDAIPIWPRLAQVLPKELAGHWTAQKHFSISC